MESFIAEFLERTDGDVHSRISWCGLMESFMAEFLERFDEVIHERISWAIDGVIHGRISWTIGRSHPSQNFLTCLTDRHFALKRRNPVWFAKTPPPLNPWLWHGVACLEWVSWKKFRALKPECKPISFQTFRHASIPSQGKQACCPAEGWREGKWSIHSLRYLGVRQSGITCCLIFAH